MAVRGDDHLSQSRNEGINLCLDQKIETNRPLTSYVSDNYKALLHFLSLTHAEDNQHSLNQETKAIT